jgi:hypothetical protein
LLQGELALVEALSLALELDVFLLRFQLQLQLVLQLVAIGPQLQTLLLVLQFQQLVHVYCPRTGHSTQTVELRISFSHVFANPSSSYPL